MSCIFLDQVDHTVVFNSKLETCIVNIFQQGEDKAVADEYCKSFKDKFKHAISKGESAVAMLCITVSEKIYKDFGSVPLTQFYHVVSYYIAKLKDEAEQRDCINEVIDFTGEHLEKSDPNTYIIILNGVFNAIDMTNKNRIILLKKLIKVCKEDNKEYLFAPYLLDINDLLNLSVYELSDQLDIYEEFLEVIENTIKKDDLFLLAIEYMKLQNEASDAEFRNREKKLLKYILKVVSDDKRLFDIESILSQKCSKMILANNANLKKSFETITSGDIHSIKTSYKDVQEILKKHGTIYITNQQTSRQKIIATK